jgi:hypothetical protein
MEWSSHIYLGWLQWGTEKMRVRRAVIRVTNAKPVIGLDYTVCLMQLLVVREARNKFFSPHKNPDKRVGGHLESSWAFHQLNGLRSKWSQKGGIIGNDHTFIVHILYF